MKNNLFDHIESGPVWIFTADRKLSEGELNQFKTELNQFASSWEAHGNPVAASYSVIDDIVMLVAADASKCDVTGCSKDKLHHFMLAFGRKIGVDFFNRMLIPVFENEKIGLVHWNDIESLVQNGELSETQQYIDATASSVEVFRDRGVRSLKSLLVAR